MKILIQISLSLLFPLLATSCRKETAPKYLEVPLTFTGAGIPVITATFTGGTVSLVVDSGSNRCLVDSAIAESLQLPPICPHSSSEVIIQDKTMEQVHVHDVPFTIEGQAFIVRTLMIADMPSGPSDDFDGILGTDFLRSTHAIIDIQGERLLIQKPTSPRPQGDDNRAMHRTDNPRR